MPLSLLGGHSPRPGRIFVGPYKRRWLEQKECAHILEAVLKVDVKGRHPWALF